MTDRRVGGSALTWWAITLACVVFLLGVYWAVIVVFQAVFGA